MSPPPPDPRRRSNTTVLIVITAALLGGWGAMLASGLFEQLGRPVAVATLVCDLVVLAVLWSVLFRRDLNRRK
jgi:hypothetical protein